MLKKCGFTRRAQIVTWQAWNDLGISDPACLQRLWLRVEENEGGDKKLNMNIHMRSNDAYKAAFMNMFAFIELQKVIASRLDVEVGEYIHVADSFHIYGSYFDEFENGFLKTIRERSFEERVWDYEFAIPMFVDGCDQLLAEKDLPKNKHTAVAGRKAQLIRLGA
jgi:thymidylate synthase